MVDRVEDLFLRPVWLVFVLLVGWVGGWLVDGLDSPAIPSPQHALLFMLGTKTPTPHPHLRSMMFLNSSARPSAPISSAIELSDRCSRVMWTMVGRRTKWRAMRRPPSGGPVGWWAGWLVGRLGGWVGRFGW